MWQGNWKEAMKPSDAGAPALVHWQTDASHRLTLVCFHCAGSNAQSFFAWREAARGLCDLIAVELPGRSRRYREAPADSVDQLADAFAQAIAQLPDKPLVFFGHSLGALLAYETTRALRRRRGPLPQRLILSSRQGAAWLPVHCGLPELDAPALRQYMQDLEGTPPQILENDAMMQAMLPVLRADLQLIYQYQHQVEAALEMPIEVLGGIDDQHVRFESLLGWQQASTADFRLRMVEGGHFAVMSQPDSVLDSVRQLAASLPPVRMAG